MDDPANSRIISRVTLEYVLDLLGLGLRGGPLDPVDVLIMMTLSVSNVSHLGDDPALSRRYADPDHPETPDVKRPVTRVEVAEALHLPRETARRKINRLAAFRLLTQTEGGLIAAFEDRHPDRIVAGAIQNAGLLRKTIRSLERLGVKIPRDPALAGLEPGADSDLAHLRIISRATMDYARRLMKDSVQTFGLDLTDLLVVLTAYAGNYAYLKYEPALAGVQREAEASPSVDLRRPTSRNAIAAALNMPRETVRRRIARLIEAGYLAERAGGVVGALREVQTEAADRLRTRNQEMFAAMLASLQRQGVPV